jgi:hypothetical protein
MCFLCGNFEGPFVDTGTEKEWGRIYICASTERRVGCARQIGRQDGLYEPYSIDEINNRLEEAIARLVPTLSMVLEDKTEHAITNVTKLTDMVEELAKSKLVPAMEVYELGKASNEN